MKRQRIVHSYGDDEDLANPAELQAELEERMQAGTVPNHILSPCTSLPNPSDVEVVLGGKKCKCVHPHISVPHTRTVHLKKRKFTNIPIVTVIHIALLLKVLMKFSCIAT